MSTHATSRREQRTPAVRPQRVTPARQERSSAVVVGLLYLAATVAGLVAAGIGAPTEPAAMAADRGAVLGSALAVTVMALAVIGVAVMLYPILSRDADTAVRRGMATGYFASRVAEGTLFLVGVVAVLTLLTLGEDTAVPAGEGASLPVAAALQAVNDYSAVLGQTVFGVGALLLYWLLYVSRRVPAWLALWGFAAAPLFLVSGALLPFTHDPSSAVSSALYAPLAVQEMVLAGWLIVRGFRPIAVTSRA